MMDSGKVDQQTNSLQMQGQEYISAKMLFSQAAVIPDDKELIYPVLRYRPPLTYCRPEKTPPNERSLFEVYEPCFSKRFGRIIPLSSDRASLSVHEPSEFPFMDRALITGHYVDREAGYDLVSVRVNGKDRDPSGRLYHMIWSAREDVTAALSPAEIQSSLLNKTREDCLEKISLRAPNFRIMIDRALAWEYNGRLKVSVLDAPGNPVPRQMQSGPA